MADARHPNPIVAGLIDDLTGRLRDVDAVQRHLDLVRAENAALYAEAAAQLVLARRLLLGAVIDAAARRAFPESESKPEEEAELVLVTDDPEVAARTAAYLEAVAHVERVQHRELLLIDALGFLLVARAFSFALTRAHLLPGVLLTVAAAYALAYAASWGAVVPGPASLLRISVLLLCLNSSSGSRWWVIWPSEVVQRPDKLLA
ncbi:hypothetical protein BAE44_0002871 [Dichanthelium oligosanthes]|uniref:Uncharacterized protein n=1 Tax=Dichanthelium oligosanthes TaxID=888268 RepID=A0A1E5WG34_9POAL|nr:hypothetical protein BAE44_0002871 [Dichanthelium oligosanthes]